MMMMLARREIIAADVAVSARLDEFIQICSTTPSGRDEVRTTVQEAFSPAEVPAEAVLSTQMLRSSPAERQKTRDELAALDVHIASIED
ncbi:hypothetical protein [Microbacterium plantarum]|uniref:hypothetical protein n=1 Tax=Microbacterium plantarum TaxID=1816425 RepID=UPI002B484BD0|nr:hypothetical protein [Microbacterium plantarum]WRK17113.1 hypothetical protein VC184_14565 [Microbacterium plantarum]